MNGLTSFRIRRWLAALLTSAVLAPAALAGTTGKISGVIRDSEKKEALPAVTVFVEGTRLGAIANDQGRFQVINVPAGRYTLRAKIVGYNDYVLTNIEVRPDFTTEVEMAMVPEAVKVAPVIVEAERPLIQKDATGTTRFIGRDDIQKLPTRGYRDAAANQTGIVNFQRQIDREAQNQNTLIVRGGRPNETAYYVDGFSQQDPLTGTSSTSISNNAIEEVVVLTGGYNPEYGRIMSGVVNVITREGASKYFGALEGVTDNLAGDWVKARKTDYNIYDASLGGPLFPGKDNLTFYASGERRWLRDRQPGFLTDQYRETLESLGLDPDFKPANSSEGWTWQGKVAWRINDAMNLKAGTLGSDEDWQQYLHAYLFNLPHAPRYSDRNRSYFGSFNHVLNKNTFWNLALNYFMTERKNGDGVHFDDLGAYYRESNPRFDINVPIFWSSEDGGHVYDDYLQRKSSYWGAQGSITSQINPYNQFKAGGDFQRHTLRFFEHYFPVQLGGTNPNLDDFDAYGYTLEVTYDADGVVNGVHLVEQDSGRDGPKHPRTWSLYAQDKYEREGVIVNGGLRFDHINVETESLISDRFPLGDPDDNTNIPDSLENRDLQSNKTYARLSPRLGVAFPVDTKTVLRFNYGQFYQQPNLQDLYVSYRFLQHKIRTGGYFVGFGNPNLKPERTTAYEVGAARQLGDRLRLDVTAYWKDVKDLVEITTIPSFPNNFSSYRNRDFATIKGIDIGFTMRPINHFSANMAYSLSYAKGTGSVSNTQRNIAWTASQPPKQTAPLDFDQRHKLSANLDWRLAKGEGPAWGNTHPFENLGVNLLFNVASGTPFTPTTVYNEITLAAVASQPSGPLNSRYGPWTSTLDLKANRGFEVSRINLDAFVWVLNLFDVKNATAVYTSSGSAETTNWLNTTDGEAFLETAASQDVDGLAIYRLAENNPNLYSNPRQVRFGLRASF